MPFTNLKQMLLAIDVAEYCIDVTGSAKTLAPSLPAPGRNDTEFYASESDGLTANRDALFSKQALRDS